MLCRNLCDWNITRIVSWDVIKMIMLIIYLILLMALYIYFIFQIDDLFSSWEQDKLCMCVLLAWGLGALFGGHLVCMSIGG